ncbi:MAG: hypothetical protein E3J37_05150 [Anaerolineales bacterium]|nr:MAG: hypothetical protein E3J37_05150 [Anaerolineales bacterium]
MNSRVSPAEWRWLAVVSLLIMALSSLPVVAGFAAQTPEMIFNGTVIDRQDFAVHLASMQRGLQGEWEYSLLFTTEPSNAKPVKLAYITLGHIARWLHLDLVLTYHIGRWVFGFGVLAMIYRLMAMTFKPLLLRRIGFLLAATASGLGWLMLAIDWLPDPQIWPVDFWLIDMYTLFSLATFPHFAAVALLILTMAISYLNFIETGKVGYWVLTAIAGVLIIPIQPFSVAIGDLIAGGAVIASWRKQGKVRLVELMALTGLIAAQAPLLWLNARAFTTGTTWQNFAAQHIMLSPPPIYYLLGIGILGPMAAWGGYIAWRRRNLAGVMALCWTVGALILCYAPLRLQRRFSVNLTVPLGLLAAMALGLGFLPWLSKHQQWKRWGSLLMLLVVVVASPSSLYLSAGNALYASGQPAPIFDPASLVRAVDWLGEHAGPDDALLASTRSGLLVPPRTGLRTYVGHPIETLDYTQKDEQVKAFFRKDGMTMVERMRFLSECGCDWVIFGPYEGGEDEAFDPGSLSVLQLEYQEQGIRLYRIIQNVGAVYSQPSFYMRDADLRWEKELEL